MRGFGNDIRVNVLPSAILLCAGFLWGKYKERRRFGLWPEEYILRRDGA